MSMQEQLLFDLIESESMVNVFFDRENFTAISAGIIITGSAIGHFPKKRGDKITLWFGRGVIRETFKKKKEAYQKAIEIIGKADQDLKLRIEGRDAKKFQKLLDSIITSEKRIKEEG